MRLPRRNPIIIKKRNSKGGGGELATVGIGLGLGVLAVWSICTIVERQCRNFFR